MLVYNEDSVHFVATRYGAGIEVTEENLREYIYSFKGSQVTDFAMNVNCTVSTAESEVLETFTDKYLATEENGVAVDYKDTWAREMYRLSENKTDIYNIWIKALREVGINPWISIRMNDCHCSLEKAHLVKSSYIEKHPEYHVAAHRERMGYFDRCLNFAKDEVRSMMLDYIDEMLDRYDVYGLELDMTREMFFFEFGQESLGRPIMKQLMYDVDSIRKKYEKKYGHEIKLSLMISPEPRLAFERGMDVLDFVDILDMVIIISRWETTNTDMPIEIWKQILNGKDVLLLCGQQLLYAPYRLYKPATTSVKMAFGQAISNLSRGSDGVYLYNYMDMCEVEGIGEWSYEESIRNDANRPLIFSNIGKIETLIRQERSHVVTYSDFATYNVGGAYTRLPVEFHERTEYECVRIPVGKLPANAKLNLILGLKNEDVVNGSDITVYVNSAPALFVKHTKIEPKIYEHDCYVFEIGGNRPEIMYAEIKINKKCMLEYVEIEVCP